MEKHEDVGTGGVHPLMRTQSHAWSVEEEASHQSQDGDAEPHNGNLELSRTVSGPPYTIFSHRAKMFIVASVSVSSLISPFGATTFYPAINVLADQLHVTPTLMNLALTTYMIAQAIAPSIIAGLSDASGRRLSFIICFVIYLCANIGLALQTNYAALLVLRPPAIAARPDGPISRRSCPPCPSGQSLRRAPFAHRAPTCSACLRHHLEKRHLQQPLLRQRRLPRARASLSRRPSGQRSPPGGPQAICRVICRASDAQ